MSSARTAASTRRSPRRASSAPRSAWRSPAGGPCARCSTRPSATPRSTRSSATWAGTAGAAAARSSMPLVIRMPYGGGVRAPELHEDSPEAYYAHAPGVKVAIPATPGDAKGLIAAAIRDPDPVVVLEPKALYRTADGPVPGGDHVVELGRAVVARSGNGRDPHRLRRDGAGRRWRPPSASPSGDGRGRGPRPAHPVAARRGGGADLGREDRPGGDRARGTPHGGLRRRGRRPAGRPGDPRPSRARCAASPATTSPTPTGRSRIATCRASSESSRRSRRSCGF